MNDMNESRRSILLVDDTPANLKVLTSILREYGYNTRAVPSGKLALQSLEIEQPDLILLDINMPDMDGYEVCKTIKKTERFSRIPIIFISALDDIDDKVKAFSAGGVDYVTKPFQFEEVIVRVRTHMELYSLRSELEKRNKDLSRIVKEQVKEISDSQMATIFAITKMAEARDNYTGQHLERVQSVCRILATKLSETERYKGIVDDEFIENITYSSMLHDIGKVGISDAILLKPGKLTPEEFEIIKSHSVIGYNTLETVAKTYPENKFVQMGRLVTRHHHEKWDGSGYPDGIGGESIDIASRIMAIADVYDALMSERCYKKAYSHEKSCEIISEGRGVSFDPFIVDVFIENNEAFKDAFDFIVNNPVFSN